MVMPIKKLIMLILGIIK